MESGEKEMLLMFPPARLAPHFLRRINASPSSGQELFMIYDIRLLKLFAFHDAGSVTFGNP